MNTPLSFSMFARRPRASLVRPKRHALGRRAAGGGDADDANDRRRDRIRRLDFERRVSGTRNPQPATRSSQLTAHSSQFVARRPPYRRQTDKYPP
ncbi:hypothetical protein, partial [Burkholderia pseudomallei]|uniref:hypothetical protein n=1 Tax=Burkholderia pseudomallei TaxID=28450 RepID=UPI001EFA8792